VSQKPRFSNTPTVLNYYHTIIEQVRSQSKQELNLRKWGFEQVRSTFSLAVIAGSVNYVVIIVETCYIHLDN